MAGVAAAVGGGWSGSDSATSASVGGITVLGWEVVKCK